MPGPCGTVHRGPGERPGHVLREPLFSHATKGIKIPSLPIAQGVVSSTLEDAMKTTF